MEKIAALVNRFWNDVAGLPWQDKSWVGNEALKEQTRTHFVNATIEDINQACLQAVVDRLDAMMEGNPSRELADTSNYLQAMLKEGDNATVPSND